MHVWLRRAEAKMKEVKLLAQGFADMSANGSNVSGIYQEFVNAFLPFAAEEQLKVNKAMIEIMEKEVARGPLRVSPMSMTPLKNTARKLSMPDEYRQKLATTRKVRLP